MKNLVFNMLMILCLTMGCDKKIPPLQVNLLAEEKKVFLDKLNFDEDTKILRYQLDSAAISLEDIVHYCQGNKKDAHNIALIQVACAGMSNHLIEENNDYWAGILYEMQRFYENVEILKTEDQKVFMDVGAGNGEKLFAALCLNFEQAIGIEYSSSLVEIANQNLRLFTASKAVQNIHNDAFSISSEVYAKADFIYLYSPIKDNMLMAKLTQKLLLSMHEGAILLEVRFVYGTELAKLMQWQLPQVAGLFAIKKVGDNFYFATYDHHQTHWHQIETVTNP